MAAPVLPDLLAARRDLARVRDICEMKRCHICYSNGLYHSTIERCLDGSTPRVSGRNDRGCQQDRLAPPLYAGGHPPTGNVDGRRQRARIKSAGPQSCTQSSTRYLQRSIVRTHFPWHEVDAEG